MFPPRPARRLTPALLLAVLPGCSWVHQRQSLFPNAAGRVADTRNESRPSSRDRTPRVNLRVDPTPLPDGPALDPKPR